MVENINGYKLKGRKEKKNVNYKKNDCKLNQKDRVNINDRGVKWRWKMKNSN